GGSFRIEQLDGSLGDLFSPDDPIIRSVGDVSFNSYLGTSLHILAGGAVEIDSVIITGNETGTEGIDFISEAITLSNGTVVDINGQTEPTLDIRAGVDPTEVGIPGLTGNQFFGDLFNLNLFGRPTITNTATSADITIGTIAFANVSIFDFNISPNDLLAGKVLLTNQYKPNPSLAGDIEVSATLGSLVPTLENLAIQNGELSQGGSVTIDSRGSITLNGIVNTIAIPNNNPFNPFSGNGGDVTFLANDNITLNPGSFIASAGIEGGKITLNSGSHFLLDDSGVVTVTTGAGVGGNLIVNAPESVTLINTEGSGFSNLGELVTNFTNSNLVERLFRVFNGSGLATVTTGPGDSGDLSINTRTLSIRNQAQNQESRSLAGAATVTLSGSSGNSGNLTVNAESVDIVGNETDPFIPTPNERLALAIRAIPTGLTTATNSTGKAGDLTINTQRLTVQNGAGVTTATVRRRLENAKDGGNLTINATESVTLSGKVTLATATLNSGNAGELKVNTPTLTLEKGAVIAADTTGSGNAGNLTIKTDQLLVRDGSRIGAATGNSGTGANITVMASEVELVGTAVDDENTVVPSGIFANSQFINNERNELGDAGSININTEKLIVRDGAVVSSSTEGAGAGGTITITTPDLTLQDQGQISASTSGKGRSGSIVVENADSVQLADNSSISTEVKAGAEVNPSPGEEVGKIAIKTRSLTLNESDITASTSGEGDAGSITIQDAQQVNLNRNSSISTAVNTGAEGNGGDIDIQTKSISLDQTSNIEASTAGQGNAGSIKIADAEDVSLNRNSSISTEVKKGAIVQKDNNIDIDSNIDIKTRSLTLNESDITASTSGIGDAGSITIQEAQQVDLNRNSSISTAVNTGADGNGGNVNIETKSLALDHTSTIEASTAGQGNAGSITIPDAEEVNLNRNSSISTAVNSGAVAEKGGNIDLKTRSLKLTNSSNITASTSGIGDAGSIKIQEAQQVDLNRNSSISTAVNTGAVGNGGNVDIETKSLSLDHTSTIEASTAGTGDAGSISIPDAEEVDLNRNSSISTAVNPGAVGNGGNVDIKTRTLTLTNDSEITSSTAGDGDAGNITLRAEQVTIQGESQVSATTSRVTNTDRGKGGNIKIIEANRFEATDGGNVRTTTEGTEQAGNITLEVRDDITLAGTGSGLFANTTSGSSGDGGNIFVDPRTVTIRDGAKIAVDSQGQGKGGSITLEAGTLTLNNKAELSAETASTQGGNITLTIDELLFLRRNSKISTTAGTAQAGGDGGNITIKAPFILGIRQENSDITANAFEGNGGNINITTQGIIGLEFREKLTPLSDITASSEFGVDGTVNINAPGIDPSQGLSELPTDVIDVSQLIEKNLCAAGELYGGSPALYPIGSASGRIAR
ncbi:MAG: S-layer family protein, partial [Moorea sp. SIO4G2]|nr:S-layer family protein [Moorena sp. SIO4G2]